MGTHCLCRQTSRGGPSADVQEPGRRRGLSAEDSKDQQSLPARLPLSVTISGLNDFARKEAAASFPPSKISPNLLLLVNSNSESFKERDSGEIDTIQITDQWVY